MIVGELINQLNDLHKKHGNVQVMAYCHDMDDATHGYVDFVEFNEGNEWNPPHIFIKASERL